MIPAYSILAVFNMVEDDATIDLKQFPYDLKQQYQNFLEKIRVIQNLPLEAQAENVFSDFLHLRVNTFKWLVTENNFDLILEVALDEIHFLKSNIKDAHLRDSISRSTEIIESVLNSLITEFKASVGKDDFTIESLFQTISKNVQTDELTAIDFFKESVKSEYGIILADLFANDMLEELPRDLADFVYNSTQKYGAYSLIFGLWKPEQDATLSDNEVLGCKILAEIMQVEKGRSSTINLTDLPR